jgi:hypothetical protein
VVDLATVDEELEILGHPRLVATVRSSVPVAYLSAKLCDVHPDGTSQLVTRGLLNLTHRDSHERPEPLVPGEDVEISVELEVASWIFEPGHTIRLDLAGADWPNAWAPPLPGTLQIDASASSLCLPVLAGPGPVARTPQLPRPRKPRSTRPREEQLEGVTWRIDHDVVRRVTRAEARYGGFTEAEAVSPPLTQWYGGIVGVSTVDPGVTFVDAGAEYELRYPETTVRSKTTTRIWGDAEAYDVEIEISASEAGGETWERRWQRRIPRDLQ